MLIQYQGYTVQTPPAPSEQGDLAPHPTDREIVSQIDQQFVHWYDPTIDTVVGNTPANTLVSGTLTFQCYWDTVFNAVAQNSQVVESVTYTIGVTTTDSDTKTFGMSFGVEAPIVPGVKAALSASFSESETHSVAISEAASVTQSFTALPGTTLQVWQLIAEYIVEYTVDGKTYRNVLSNAGSVADGVVLALTYPEVAVT